MWRGDAACFPGLPALSHSGTEKGGKASPMTTKWRSVAHCRSPGLMVTPYRAELNMENQQEISHCHFGDVQSVFLTSASKF